MKIYVAAKWEERERASLLMNKLTKMGHEITWDWTTETSHDPQTLVVYSCNDCEGVKSSSLLVVYAENELPYRGSYVEMGIALGQGKDIYLIGHGMDACIFTNHPRITRFETEDDFIQFMLRGK